MLINRILTLHHQRCILTQEPRFSRNTLGKNSSLLTLISTKSQHRIVASRDYVSKKVSLNLVNYEQQTVQNNNTPSIEYRNNIQHSTLETPTVTTKFIPPLYCNSNGQIPNEILLPGDTLILEHEITPASLHSYTTVNDNPSTNLEPRTSHST